MRLVPRLLSAALLASALTAPSVVRAELIEGPQATLMLFGVEGEEIGSYNLFDYGLDEEALLARVGKGDDDEQEPDETLTFFISDEVVQANGNLGFKFDPFVQFAIGLANFTAAPINYVFLFSTPYVAGPYNSLTASISSSFTDGGRNPNGSVNINPFTFESIVDGTTYLTLTTPCSFSGTPGTSGACPSDADATNLLSLTTGTLSARISFTLSARDLISVNGRTDLTNTVAEPATLALLGAGLLGLAIVRRRVFN